MIKLNASFSQENRGVFLNLIIFGVCFPHLCWNFFDLLDIDFSPGPGRLRANGAAPRQRRYFSESWSPIWSVAPLSMAKNMSSPRGVWVTITDAKNAVRNSVKVWLA